MDKNLDSAAINEIFKLIQPASEKWEEIGLILGLSRDALHQIKLKSNVQGQPKKCLYATINAWLLRKGKDSSRITWRALINTLESAEVDESALAQSIMDKKGFVRYVKSTVQKPQVFVPHEEKAHTGVEVGGSAEEVKSKMDGVAQVETSDEADRALGHDDHLDITDYLFELESQHIYNLGIVLGLDQHKVKGMKESPGTFLDDIVSAWLRRESNVDKCGKPCWRTLVKALTHKRLLMNGLADKIATEKGFAFKDESQIPEVTSLENYLRSFYCAKSQHDDTDKWPPTLDVEYINLKLITQDEIPVSEQQSRRVELSKQGNIDSIVNQNKTLTLDGMTDYASSRKVILIEGAPGIGKTTLALKLCREWANRKLLTEFSLVLYVPLRVPLMRVAESPSDLLLYFKEHCSSADIKYIQQSHGSMVLFILDGWDELRPSCRLPDSFFPRLIRGEFLPKCSIIITSRPGSIYSYELRSCANRLIEILGFTEEQVIQYIQSYFRKHEGTAQKLIDDLKAYPNVASTCYVAINLTIICYVYLASSLQLPSTLTEVYEQFVIHTVKRHIKKTMSEPSIANLEALGRISTVSGFNHPENMILIALGRLALNGLEHGDLSFTRKELTDICHINESEEFHGLGLLKSFFVYRKHGSERNYHFLHGTIQEYLAAYAVVQMEENERKQWLYNNLIYIGNRYEMVYRFFCGMDQFNFPFLKTIFAVERVISDNFTAILQCIFEGQWEDGCNKIAQKWSTLVITPQSHMEPYQALVYGYVMAKSRTQWKLHWRGCTCGEHELKCMSRYLKPSPTTLTQISLVNTSFVNKEAEELFLKIIQSQVQLSELRLDTAQLDDSSLSGISKAVCSHQLLNTISLRQNRITERSSESIASLLVKLPALQILDLSANIFGKKSHECIHQAVLNIASSRKFCLQHIKVFLSLEHNIEIEVNGLVILFL